MGGRDVVSQQQQCMGSILLAGDVITTQSVRKSIVYHPPPPRACVPTRISGSADLASSTSWSFTMLGFCRGGGASEGCVEEWGGGGLMGRMRRECVSCE